MNKYKETTTIKWHQINAAKELRYYSFMNLAQEIANDHACSLKFGYDELIDHNNIWVLSRVHIKYIKPPKWRDTVSIETWHKGKNGLFWTRDFKLSYPNGEVGILATSSWLIINTQTRRIERNTIFDNSSEALDSTCNEDAIAQPCEKISNPSDGLNFYREYKVQYSDIDFNLHANNAKYIEWVIDTLPAEILQRKKIKELKINYITEARFGDNIEIYASDFENGIYFQGNRDKDILFTAKIYF